MNERIVRHVPLPECPIRVPSLSLHVLAKNAESVLGRLVENVGPYIQKARFVLNDTTDASEKVLAERLGAFKVPYDVQHVTNASHPDFYFFDSLSAYEVGRPLAGEVFEGPFMRAPLLCDWSSVRNVGWESDCAWRLHLDADDLVSEPSKIPGLLEVLTNVGADLAATRYVFGRSDAGAPNSVAYRERLARNSPAIRWTGKTHEILTGGLRHVLVEDCLTVTDMKDNWGRGVRVPGRCFKVLYREARLADWNVSPRHLAYLVQEAPGMMTADWVSGALLPAYLAVSVHPAERAWVLSMVGELWEAKLVYLEASRYYEKALAAYPSPKAAFRLSRAAFMQEKWRECVEAYDRGVALLATPQVLDDGPVYEHSGKIFAAQACYTLGEIARARDLIGGAACAFPESSLVAALRQKICGTAL